MEILVTWLILCAVPAILATYRGRRPLVWYALSVLFTPLVGLLFVALLPSKKAEQAEAAEVANRRPCPRCGERIARSASLCRYCNTEVTPLAV